MQVRIFYAWQADRPQERAFIQEATQLAIEHIGTDANLVLEPVLDRDTEGMPGSPAIAQAILEKIEQCNLFLCDVTLVTPPGVPRAIPNPNVLIELGYAAAKKGWERIICVMNEVYGGPTKLPFDLQHRRWPIRYSLAATATDTKRAQEKERLSQAIELAIRTAKENGLLARVTDPKDRRVAYRFAEALEYLRVIINAYMEEGGLDNAWAIFLEDHPDMPGTAYPDPALVEPLVSVLAHKSLKGPSIVLSGDQQLTWAEAFATELNDVTRACDRLLNQYADRDEMLIEEVEAMFSSAKGLAFLIDTSVRSPELTALYDDGVPSVHLDSFRYFFLELSRVCRVLRQFRWA